MGTSEQAHINTPVKALYVAEAAGLGVSITGVTSVLGYITNSPVLYTWSFGIGMAFPTALCFLSIGVSILILARELEHR